MECYSKVDEINLRIGELVCCDSRFLKFETERCPFRAKSTKRVGMVGLDIEGRSEAVFSPPLCLITAQHPRDAASDGCEGSVPPYVCGVRIVMLSSEPRFRFFSAPGAFIPKVQRVD